MLVSTHLARRAAWLACVCSAFLSPAIFGQEPREPGLLLRLYDIQQEVHFLPQLVEGQMPNFVRIVPTIDLQRERGDFGEFKELFLTEVAGWLHIQTAGTYNFRLLSDDGAQLWIDGRLVIDHDGIHGATPKDGRIELAAGQHDLRIWHFQCYGGAQLTLLWNPPSHEVTEDRRAESASKASPAAQSEPEALRSTKSDTQAPTSIQSEPEAPWSISSRTEPSAIIQSEPEAQARDKPPPVARKTPPNAPAVDFELLPAVVLSHSAGAPNDTAPGKKKIIPPLRRGRPGDGSPLTGTHPGFATDGGGVHSDGRSRLAGCYIQSAGQLDGPERRLLIWVPDRSVRSPDSATFDLPGELFAGQKQVITDIGELKRVFIDVTGRTPQGCVFRLARTENARPLTRPTDDVVFEMRCLRALANGLEIEFTRPLDPRVGWDPQCYYIEQWPFDMANGRQPQRDGRVYPVKSASVSPDRRKVFLEIDNLKASHVIYIRLLPPCLSEDGELPWSTEAWYTLNALPTDRLGAVLAPPPQPPQNVLTDEQKAAGWRLLFDGQTTNGWHGYGKDHFPAGWVVQNGCLVRVGPGGDIVTDEEFDNFELELEWRISAGGNSGIFFRVGEGPPYRWVWETGPEMQVLDNAEHPDGQNPLTSAGSNYALHAPLRDVTQPLGFFNQVRIVADGPHIEHWLNGVKIVEYEIGSPRWERLVADSKFAKMPHYGRLTKGRIALQDHGDQVWYRNIKVRRLPPRPPS